MAGNNTQFNSSVGRIVWGHPIKLEQRKDNDEKLIFKEDGTPSMGVAFGLAIPKTDFLANEWPKMQAEAAKGYPSGAPQNFSWKIKDGDTDKDSKGVPLSAKEGYAGCYILTVASNTGFSPAVYRFNGQNYDQMQENEIKCGDYVSVALNIALNVPKKSTHTPSLYVNPDAIEFVGYGKALASGGVNPMQAFGGRQHQLPPGASATPVAGAGGGVAMPGAPMGGMPGNGHVQPGMPASQAPVGMPVNGGMPSNSGPTAMPGAYPTNQQPQQPGYPAPAHDFVQNAGYPAQPQQMPQYQQPQQMPQYQQPHQMPGAPMGGVGGGMPGMPGPR